MPTQVTVKLITEYLERFGWKYYKAYKEMGEKEGGVSTSWRAEDGRTYSMTIDPIEERSCLVFRVLELAQAPWESAPPEALRDLLTLLAALNHSVLLAKFCYNILSGEVALSADIPTDDSALGYAQFEHTMGILLGLAEKWSPRLQSLLQGETKLGELLLQRAEEAGMSKDSLAQLQQALKRREEALSRDEPLTEV